MSTVTPANGLAAGELEALAVNRANLSGREAQAGSTPEAVAGTTASAASEAVSASAEAQASTRERPNTGSAEGEDAGAAEARADADDAAEERARELAQQLVDDALKPFAKLQITRDENSDRFIYTTIDSRNGEIIQQFPREELLNALASPQDAEGLVVDRRV